MPALAARPVTVAELDQLLASLAGKPDAAVAEQLDDVTLTERASSAQLAKWQSKFPGSHARDALVVLTDMAAFLDLPATEVPALPIPEPAERQRILTQTIEYVNKTLPRLPNFLAQRDTTYFEDSPSVDVYDPTIAKAMKSKSEYRPLHAVDKSSTGVTYRDGREVPETDTQRGRKAGTHSNLMTTTGEFGPIILVVLRDAIHGQVNWSHWEQGPEGTPGAVAVLRYTVPAEKSHYGVVSACKAGIGKEFPAYHGEIAIDPKSGSIQRLKLVAEMKPDCRVEGVSIVVEYGPVEIGGNTYICPLKSVTMSAVEVTGSRADAEAAKAPVQIQLNDVEFSGYHRFRAEARILSGDETQPVPPKQ